MAFPTIPTVAAGRVLSALATNPAGTHTSPNLSSLTKNAGDLLIAIVILYDGNSTNAEFSAWGGGFTEFGDFAGTSTMAIGVAYKWSTGSEAGTFTVTSADTSANDSAFFLLSIPGAHASTPPEAGSFVTGTAAAADPGSFNPSGWDAEDTLWIAVAGSGETSTTGSYTGVASAPTNYSDYVDSGISADVVGGVEGAVAFRQLNAASVDVGTFSVDTSNARNAALVIAVRPIAPQFITPSGLVHTRAFGTALIVHSVVPPSVTRTRAIGTAVLPRKGRVTWAQMQVPEPTTGAQLITPTGFEHTRAFGTAIVGRGAVVVVPNSTLHSRAVSAPLIILYVRPSGVVHARAFGTALLIQTITPSSLVHTRAFGNPSVASASQVLQPESVQHGRAFGAPFINPRRGRVTWAQLQIPTIILNIFPPSVVHTRAIGAPLVFQSKVYPPSVVHSRAFGFTGVIGNQVIAPQPVIHARATGTAFVGLEPQIAAAGLIWLWGDVEFGKIEPGSTVHDRVVGIAKLTMFVVATSTVHTRAFGTTLVGRFINVTSTVHTRAFGLPQLNKSIAVPSVVHNRAVETPTIAGGITTIVATGIVHTRALGTAIVTVSAFSQTIIPPPVVHARNITGPLVTRAGDPPSKRQSTFAAEWGIDTFHPGDIDVEVTSGG